MGACAGHSDAVFGRRTIFSLLVMLGFVVGLVNPVAGGAQTGSFSAYLQEGTCGTADLPQSPPEAMATPLSSGNDLPVTVFLTFETHSTLASLQDSSHSIAIDVANGDIGTTVACGDLAGAGTGFRLVVPIFSVDTGELVGVGAFRSDGGDSQRVIADIYLVFDADGSPMGSDGTIVPGSGDDALDDDEAPDAPDDEPEGGV